MLKGRTVLFLGSSVTDGSAAGGVSFVDLLPAAVGCRAIKEAVPGTTLVDTGPDSYVSRMRALDGALPLDLFVCQLSTNDVARGYPLGKIGDAGADTVAGAIETIAREARAVWKCPVAFYTNPRFESEAYAAMVSLLLALAARRDFYTIDLWSDPTFNALTNTQRSRFMADPVHPTLEGYRDWMLPKIIECLEEILQ